MLRKREGIKQKSAADLGKDLMWLAVRESEFAGDKRARHPPVPTDKLSAVTPLSTRSGL
ncbi:hypothetical protein GCM10023333_04020 [Ferrimonas pelagia]|uniref:Uncharacterized protein n=1 Tax=Ferrimonas pelagia TaxID=1177826 RepID=A0ABP9EEA5_9GAMM